MSNDAAAQYKKQDGTLSVSTDGKTVSWKAASGAAALSIATADIGSELRCSQTNKPLPDVHV